MKKRKKKQAEVVSFSRKEESVRRLKRLFQEPSRFRFVKTEFFDVDHVVRNRRTALSPVSFARNLFHGKEINERFRTAAGSHCHHNHFCRDFVKTLSYYFF